ncbi:FAD binding domain protein [Stachybotrys elegans]|uniref:FAD binding domain protein n=1 Tax=Stachybotrys elegans TaxID=80388 RepID=A0A8K0WJP0_9HYPO|nr:FAD binding domain protein [Stachybotrys elegans]
MFYSWLLALCATAVLATPPRQATCRNIPGDPSWPKLPEWNRLNRTVNGRLIATVPISHVCHDPTYDEEACNALRRDWGPPHVQLAAPAEFFAPWFLNQSCVPQTDRSRPCELGNYAVYSIDVRSPQDAAAGMAFAQQHNIRLTIQNTGHDITGKSSGLGSLSLWTHNLRNIQLIESYRSSYYNGPAVKVAAGVLGGDALEFATNHGYRLVGGNCPTVGVAGGFTQGGGYGPLTAMYGLSADNVLEWEVVTADGRLLVATPTKNRDLYYALSGGGGGTYGVVMSMTTRLFPEEPVARASLTFNVSTAGSTDSYWNAIATFVDYIPSLVEKGLGLSFEIREETFAVTNILAADGTTSEELQDIIQPLLSGLSEVNGLPAESLGLDIVSMPTHYELYTTTGAVANTSSPSSIGGHFFSRESVAANAAGILDVLRLATQDNLFRVSCQAFDVRSPVRSRPVAENGVTDSWRDNLFNCFFPTIWTWTNTNVDEHWSEVAGLQDRMMNVITPAVEAVSQGDGAYINGVNHAQPNFQDILYGHKYEHLRAIKRRYDPKDLFYAVTAVGSEVWSPDSSGRLCRRRV